MDDDHHHFYQNIPLFLMTREIIVDNCFHDNFILFLYGSSYFMFFMKLFLGFFDKLRATFSGMDQISVHKTTVWRGLLVHKK